MADNPESSFAAMYLGVGKAIRRCLCLTALRIHPYGEPVKSVARRPGFRSAQGTSLLRPIRSFDGMQVSSLAAALMRAVAALATVTAWSFRCPDFRGAESQSGTRTGEVRVPDKAGAGSLRAPQLLRERAK
jgi:hypothetical protein